MKRFSCLKAAWPFNRVPAWGVSLAPKWAVRIQRDFRAVRVSNATTMQERVVDGIVFKP
jgi:hypothetical protein